MLIRGFEMLGCGERLVIGEGLGMQRQVAGWLGIDRNQGGGMGIFGSCILIIGNILGWILFPYSFVDMCFLISFWS